MKRIVFAILLSTCALSFVSAQVGIQFPNLAGETLKGRNVTLPDHCIGMKTIVMLASGKKAEDDLVSWQQPMYDKFVAKVGIFDSDYDVNLFFVPMFTGLNQTAYESTLKKLKKENKSELYDYVVFYKGEAAQYEASLKMTDNNKPYLFLLNEQGKIIYTTNGAFTEKKMEDLEQKLN